MIITIDSITAGLRRYSSVSKNYVPNEFKFGIGRDRVQYFLWHAGNIDLSKYVQIVLFQFGTNNTDHGKPCTITNEIKRYISIFPET